MLRRGILAVGTFLFSIDLFNLFVPEQLKAKGSQSHLRFGGGLGSSGVRFEQGSVALPGLVQGRFRRFKVVWCRPEARFKQSRVVRCKVQGWLRTVVSYRPGVKVQEARLSGHGGLVQARFKEGSGGFGV